MTLSEQDVGRIIREEAEKIAEAKVKSILTEMLGLNNNHNPQYLPTSKAWKELGYQSRKQLIGAIRSGDLREGKEYQDRSSAHSQKPLYYFNIKACLERLNTPREKRG